MPELPEVETIRRGLASRLPGRRVEGVDFRPGKRLRFLSPRPLEGLEGERFGKPERLGKFLLLRLEGGGTLLVHLGMTGKLTLHEVGEPERAHTHLVLALDDGTELRFSDPRRFGLLRLYGPGEAIPDLEGYGPDALGRGFTAERLRAALAGSRSPVKAVLMDQRKVAGVGNIYACEALWRAGIAPTRPAREVPAAKVRLLHESVRAVLRDSIGRGGTSFNDYVDHIGQPGRFVAELAVYDREGLPCPRCGSKVRRIVQSSRSTFHCARCQR
jgi:formamidopyrimidine-DNA glycosylase